MQKESEVSDKEKPWEKKRKEKKRKSRPEHLGNYFENYIQYLKTQTVVL